MARTPAVSIGNRPSTRATDLYDQLRADLVNGLLEPGSKLGIDALAGRYATSATPLREALNRLISDGLVEKRELRGFVVAEVSEQDLLEITKTRCWLEEIALRESISRRDRKWEEEVVIAHHRLARTPRSLSEDHFEDNPDWDPCHRAFHRTLISGCGSKWLLMYCEQLADQHHRYRTLSAPQAFTTKRDVKSEHLQIMEAAIEGRVDEAVGLLRGHIERTASIVKAGVVLFATNRERDA